MFAKPPGTLVAFYCKRQNGNVEQGMVSGEQGVGRPGTLSLVIPSALRIGS